MRLAAGEKSERRLVPKSASERNLPFRLEQQRFCRASCRIVEPFCDSPAEEHPRSVSRELETDSEGLLKRRGA